jgi:hypothetical protein
MSKTEKSRKVSGDFYKAALLVIAVLPTCLAAPAEANVTISSGTTTNMSCSNGVCAPTAKDAVLNITDLKNLLASGNVEVTTTASGVQAADIIVDAEVGWSTSSSLSLEAYRSLTVDKPVSVAGTGGMSFATNDGGSGGLLLFGPKGHVTFANLSSGLSINGTSYALVRTLPALAAAIAANPSGAFALAGNYDASKDGTYSTSPIPTVFTGSFNGLGNSLSKLTIRDINNGDYLGLFQEIGSGGSVYSIGLVKISIKASESSIGGLVSVNEGMIANASVTGSIDMTRSNSDFSAAGLVNLNYGGTVVLSHADATITVSGYDSAAGLVGGSTGTIIQSYSEGSISLGTTGFGGGLAGANDGSITQSYSTVSVSGGETATVGGLVGENDGTVGQAYSTGWVKRRHPDNRGHTGGFVGFDGAVAGSITDGYWDTTTSHITQLNKGAGHPKNDPGITGLTTTQLQSGLPAGFDSTVWAEDANINGGLPYLIANPPRK